MIVACDADKSVTQVSRTAVGAQPRRVSSCLLAMVSAATGRCLQERYRTLVMFLRQLYARVGGVSSRRIAHPRRLPILRRRAQATHLRRVL